MQNFHQFIFLLFIITLSGGVKLRFDLNKIPVAEVLEDLFGSSDEDQNSEKLSENPQNDQDSNQISNKELSDDLFPSMNSEAEHEATNIQEQQSETPKGRQCYNYSPEEQCEIVEKFLKSRTRALSKDKNVKEKQSKKFMIKLQKNWVSNTSQSLLDAKSWLFVNPQKKGSLVEKARALREYAKIKKKHPKCGYQEISDMINVPRTTLYRWVNSKQDSESSSAEDDEARCSDEFSSTDVENCEVSESFTAAQLVQGSPKVPKWTQFPRKRRN